MIMTPAMLQSKYQQSVTNQIRLIYIGLFLGVLLCLTARNVFIRLRTLYFRKFKSPQANTDEKFKYSDGSFLTPSTTRAFKHWLSNPLAYAAYFTPIELMLLLVVTVINVTSVLVSKICSLLVMKANPSSLLDVGSDNSNSRSTFRISQHTSCSFT